MSERDGDSIKSPSHESPDAEKLAAKFFDTHQSEILRLWTDAVFEQVPAAKGKGRSEIVDHLTILLDDIARSLREADKARFDPSLLQPSNKITEMHGRERATLPGYTVGQVSQEYIILRRVVAEYCKRHNAESHVLEAQVLELVYRAIEHAALISVSTFSESLHNIQQKLIGTLVHDVRTPLGVALTYTDILALPDAPPELRQQGLNAIKRSLGRAQGMLEELLDTSRVSAGQGLYMHFCESDINEAIDTICVEAAQVYDKRVACSLEDHPVVGIFDIGLVTRTVENLISNAVKFGDKNSPIRISLEDEGDYVSLRVHNQGDPISRADINRIFRFFYSSGSERFSSQKGWGLGLSLIKIVAKSHGGDVIAQSSEETGTTFGMILNKRYRRDGEQLSALL